MTLPLRHGSPPARYRANEKKSQGLRKGFFKATAMQKAHIASAFTKTLAPAHKQAARCEYAPGSTKNYLRASLAGVKTKPMAAGTSGRTGPASMYIMRLCTRRGVGYLYIKIGFSGPRLHGVPCCIIGHYVKSGFGGPPYLWRLLQTAQNGAWQPVSHAPTGYAGCLTAAPRTSVFPSSHPEALAKPDNRTSLRSLRAVTLFASKKSVPRQPSAPCKQVLNCNPMLSNSVKSPCRSTGKANIYTAPVQAPARLRQALLSASNQQLRRKLPVIP